MKKIVPISGTIFFHNRGYFKLTKFVHRSIIAKVFREGKKIVCKK